MHEPDDVKDELVTLDGETFHRIADSHRLPDFFLSVVGASDHWMFVTSRGALTAGRRDPDHALFPYLPDDQIAATQAITGPTTWIRTGDSLDGRSLPDVWEPFAPHAIADGTFRRNLYKTPLGNSVVFEELDDERALGFRYRWSFSERFGFVRSCRLVNRGSQPRSLELLDGLLNVLPHGVGSEFLQRFSNLANAYKRSERLADSDLGLFYLSSIPTDRAEPSEGLKATVVWQVGLEPQAVLLSPDAIEAFRRGESLQSESDVRGKVGAYLVHQQVTLEPGQALAWHVVADLGRDHTDVIALDAWLRATEDPLAELRADVAAGRRALLRIAAAADGLQCGANSRRVHRHLSNTVFNVMRGGIPIDHHHLRADDFREHVATFDRPLFERWRGWLDGLPPVSSAAELRRRAAQTADPDLLRRALEFLPLAFSRRHGDPTRPWNRFAIRLRSADGRPSLHYQGNWRDIFQNWEALAVSFPGWTTAMICRFANATTADGYNPYRLTSEGFEWEEPSPEDPWANIGYWGDHQIVYLLELLEWSHRLDPAGLDEMLDSALFVHADVPYRILPHDAIRRDPQATIRFDREAARAIEERVREIGADGKLLRDRRGNLHRVTLLEKLLTLTLAKLSNFVPGGGIWLNTQRPEWNDANNALVGRGVSVVTTCYLHRWLAHLTSWLATQRTETFAVSPEVLVFLRAIHAVLSAHPAVAGEKTPAAQRLRIVEALSRAGSAYRQELYEAGPSDRRVDLPRAECLAFLELARSRVEHTIRENRRPDGLYHAYVLLDWRADGLELEALDEMLEGQVAVLGSGLLSGAEAARLLDALRRSALYRANQDSYLLYPDRRLPRFLEKNRIDPERVAASPLLRALLADGNEELVRRDVCGGVHFDGRFRNARDVRAAVERLAAPYRALLDAEPTAPDALFEELFGHRRFTGRSGTFFAYEGLGSIYWHMVSKLALAVSDAFFRALDADEEPATIAALREHVHAIRRGIGAEKSPAEYGAFPTDPYSHTPENAGVKQPGMTGQVKEDILSRFAEVGVHVEGGRLRFRFDLFDPRELLKEAREFAFCDLSGERETLRVPAGAFAFTLCQVPVLVQPGEENRIHVVHADGQRQTIDGLAIDSATTRLLFERAGEVRRIECRFVPQSAQGAAARGASGRRMHSPMAVERSDRSNP